MADKERRKPIDACDNCNLANHNDCWFLFLEIVDTVVNKAKVSPCPADKLQEIRDALHGEEPSKLLEPLTRSELKVLRKLATDLSGPDIARSFGTVECTFYTHCKNIYQKLGVNKRTAAVKKAKELGLL